MLEAVVDAFDDCMVQTRMLFIAGMVLDEELLVKSLNFSAKCVSLFGTVRCNIHSHPFVNVPSATALLFTVSILSSERGVDDAVGVDVAVDVASCTKNEFVAMRPLVCPVAVIVIEPVGTDATVKGDVKLPLASAATVVVPMPPMLSDTCSDAPKLVPMAFTLVPGGPLYVLNAKKAVVVPVVVLPIPIEGSYMKVNVFDPWLPVLDAVEDAISAAIITVTVPVAVGVRLNVYVVPLPDTVPTVAFVAVTLELISPFTL
jgi:hypothetical protein